MADFAHVTLLQWGPVVVTGIRTHTYFVEFLVDARLQWGPVVVTGISWVEDNMQRGCPVLQWGPVVVTGISSDPEYQRSGSYCASMGSGRGDRNQ